MPVFKKKKVEAIIYRINDKNIPEFLVCKRPPDLGGFWQFVTGKVEQGESLEEAIRREILEETQVSDIKSVKNPNISFSFKNHLNVKAIEYVFLVKLPPDVEIILNHEFEKYLWLPYKDALKRLKWPNQKSNLKQVYKEI